jgi:hypothetical protein
MLSPFFKFVLSLKVTHRHGFDILHACDAPDLVFLIAIFSVKFGRQDFFYRLLLLPM